MQRSILHCDCNSFFVSVELLSHPDIKHLPVAVSGDASKRHGIILAKNEAAKAYKIATAETVQSALRKCPNLILLPAHHSEYQRYSKIINAIYAKYTDQVEPFGIDESWLDVTGTYHLFASTPMELAEKIRLEVKQQTGLTVSIGVSFNKVFAKLGSDYKKPDAITEITLDNVRKIVWPLPVGDLLYVGRIAQNTLADLGVFTIGQLAIANPKTLQQALGKLGLEISNYARGLDCAPVLRAEEQPNVKSIGNGLTFTRNLKGIGDITAGVYNLADEVASRLRKHNLYAYGVQVSIKDTNLKTIQRQMQLANPTNLAKDIGEHSMFLILKHWDIYEPIRMLTITAINLSEEYKQQMNLYESNCEKHTKRELLERSLDTIRNKYGRSAIGIAHALHNDIGIDDIEASEPSTES